MKSFKVLKTGVAVVLGLLVSVAGARGMAVPLMYQAGANTAQEEVIHVFDLGSTPPISTSTFVSSSSNYYRVYSGVAADSRGTVWATGEREWVRTWDSSGAPLAGFTIPGAALNGLGFNELRHWLYVADYNPNGALYRYDTQTNTQLDMIPYSGGAFAPTFDPVSGRVLAYTGSRTSPTFYNYTADLSQRQVISLSGGPASFSSLTANGGIAWAGTNAFYLSDYANGLVYRYALSDLDGNGLFRSATLDTSFGSGGSIHVPNSTWSSGIAFDGTSLFVASYRGGTMISKYTAGGALVEEQYLDTQSSPPYGTVNQLFIVSSSVPEIDPAGLGSVLALVVGVLGLVERRRRGTTRR